MLDYVARNVPEILKKENLSGSAVKKIQPTFGLKVLGFFLHPVVAGFLITLGFLGLLYEVKVGGWGIPGTIGVIFLSVYFISKILIGESGWGAPALFAVGGLLFALEIFVIPGFGVAGVLGLISFLISILWAYGISNLYEGLWVLSFALLGITVIVLVFMKYLPSMRLNREGLFLNDSLKSYENTPQLYESLIGKKGRTQTILRPSGIVSIEGNDYDAISRGGFIEADTAVKVISAEGSQIVVAAALSRRKK